METKLKIDFQELKTLLKENREDVYQCYEDQKFMIFVPLTIEVYELFSSFNAKEHFCESLMTNPQYLIYSKQTNQIFNFSLSYMNGGLKLNSDGELVIPEDTNRYDYSLKSNHKNYTISSEEDEINLIKKIGTPINIAINFIFSDNKRMIGKIRERLTFYSTIVDLLKLNINLSYLINSSKFLSYMDGSLGVDRFIDIKTGKLLTLEESLNVIDEFCEYNHEIYKDDAVYNIKAEILLHIKQS